MKLIVFFLGVVVLAGCASGVKKEDLELLKRELLANDVKKASELLQKVTGVDQKYVLVQQLEGDVKRHLEESNALDQKLIETSAGMDAKVERASTSVLRMLEFEERLLTERLATLRSLIEELKN